MELNHPNDVSHNCSTDNPATPTVYTGNFTTISRTGFEPVSLAPQASAPSQTGHAAGTLLTCSGRDLNSQDYRVRTDCFAG